MQYGWQNNEIAGQIAMDELDQKLLAALGADSSTSTSRLARRFKVARSTVQARIERLERTGVIAGYTVKLGAKATLSRIRATILIEVEPRAAASVITKLRSIPEVEAAHTTMGRVDIIAQLAAPNTETIDEVIEKIVGLTGVHDTESLIHLTTKFDRAF